MKIQIKSYLDELVIFEHEQEGNTIKITLEKAVKDGVNLYGADLYRTNLAGSNLYGAKLAGASLAGSNLYGAKLAGSNLSEAKLAGSNLAGSNLYGAKLAGASLDKGEILIGERPIFQIGNIGSRCDYLIAYITDKGSRIRTGCFFGDVETFKNKIKSKHGNNKHAEEYMAALSLIKKHEKIWTQDAPK